MTRAAEGDHNREPDTGTGSLNDLRLPPDSLIEDDHEPFPANELPMSRPMPWSTWFFLGDPMAFFDRGMATVPAVSRG
jgi:hypothetical protein